MPHNLTKKNYRKKRRSCPMCKPNKMRGADARTVQQRKADEALVAQFNDRWMTVR